MWHATRDTWHITRDTRHITRDTFGGVNILSLALTVCDLWYYEDLEEKDDSISDEAVYRTAPATPGLLNTGCGITAIYYIWLFFGHVRTGAGKNVDFSIQGRRGSVINKATMSTYF